MIPQKTPDEIQIMQEAGKKLGGILHELLDMAKPGVVLTDIEDRAQELIRQAGGTPSFMGVEDYRWATCLCVDDQVVHAIPTKRVLKEGEVFTVDIGMLYQGLHTDCAWTKIVGDRPPAGEAGRSEIARPPARQGGRKVVELEKFLKTGEEALEKAIEAARPGNHVGHISKAIQEVIEHAGYSVVQMLTGHGVGRKLHEEPQIPCFLRGSVERTPILPAGATLAIEVIYAMEKASIEYENEDGWTLSTRDRSIAAVFEHTIALTEGETIVLTT